MSRTLLVVFVACSVALLGCEKSEGGAAKGSAQAAEKTPNEGQESEKSEASSKEEGPFTQVGALALEGTEFAAPVADVSASAAEGVFFAALKKAPGLVKIQGGDKLSVEAAGADVKVESATEALSFDGGKKLMMVDQWEKSSAHVFEVDPKTGAVSKQVTRKAPVKFDNAVSNDGQFFYSVTPRENKLTIAKLSGDTYKEVETIDLGVNAPNESGSSQFLEVSPDGKHLYATTNRKYDEERKPVAEHRLYVYARDSKTGKLQEVEFHEHEDDKLELNQPKALAVSPDGAYVAVGGSSAMQGEIALFERDASSGKLSYVTTGKLHASGALDGQILSPDGLAFSNDSSKLYVAFADIPAVGVFAIDVD